MLIGFTIGIPIGIGIGIIIRGIIIGIEDGLVLFLYTSFIFYILCLGFSITFWIIFIYLVYLVYLVYLIYSLRGCFYFLITGFYDITFVFTN